MWLFCPGTGQLALTGWKWCDFVVFLSGSNELVVERIHFDEGYWQQALLPKLYDFYFTYASPFIVEYT